MPYVSAITIVVRDMAQAVAFYSLIGFTVVYGGTEATFSSLRMARPT